MVTSLFHGLWSHSSLITKLRTHVCEFTTCVVFRANAFEIPLQHVDVVIVVFMVNTRVPHNANAELVEAIGNFLALFLPVGIVFLIEEGLHVNYWRLDHVLELLKVHFILVSGDAAVEAWSDVLLVLGLFLLSLHNLDLSRVSDGVFLTYVNF